MQYKNENLAHNGTMEKTKRYGWKIKDLPGDMRMVHKDDLNVNAEYQRDVNDRKIIALASEWSWIACGCILVACRMGVYWVMDGQHRLLAARKRGDIDLLPCMIFQVDEVRTEATGFLDANTNRKPITSLERFNASMASGNQTAIFVNEVFKQYGIIVKRTCSGPRQTKSLSWAMRRAKEDKETFVSVVRIASLLCANHSIQEKFLEGLFYMHTKGVDITSSRVRDRLVTVGVERLVAGASRAAAFFVAGGAKVWADGMLTEMNKSVHNKFEYRVEKELCDTGK